MIIGKKKRMGLDKAGISALEYSYVGAYARGERAVNVSGGKSIPRE